MNIMITGHSIINYLKPSFLKRREKGVLLVELMVAMCIIVIGILALLGSFALFATLSAKTGNRMYAEMTAKAMMDRIRAHRYGDPEPFNWNSPSTLKVLNDIEINEVLKNRKSGNQKVKVSNFSFNKSVEYKNGSFVGKTNDNYDEITLTITWNERSAPVKTGKGNQKVNRLILVTEVRRNIPDQKD